MSWRDDITMARNKIKEITGVPKDDKTKDKQIEDVLKKVWQDAQSFDPKWDSD